MPQITVLREVISDDPIEHSYMLLDDNDEVIKSLEIDETGLLDRSCRTTTLREPRTADYVDQTSKLMDAEAEQWALDEMRRRSAWLEESWHLLSSTRVKFENVTLTEESAPWS